MLQDAAYLSEKDISQRYIRQETSYSFVVASYEPSQLAAEVAMPSEQDLQKFYEANATDYELPARVTYDFIVFNPKDFEKDVAVLPQDIELFYADNTAKYAVPEQAKVRSIKLLYPKEDDPQKMAAIREKATKVHQEALSGTPFEVLVMTYSDDLPSKAVGGARGWVARGKGSAAFDKAVFNTSVGNVSEIIEEDFGFEIIKVDERAQASTRSFDEVKSEIEKELREQEAPAYAAAKAREIVERAKKEAKPLSEIVQSLGLSISSTTEPLEQSSDPSGAPSGLTQQVMILPTSERLMPAVIDSGDLSVAVQIKDFKEPTTAPYDEVKDKVTMSFKAQAARQLAETKARELLEAIRKNPADFKKESEARKATLKGPFKISHADQKPDGYANMPEELSKAILTTAAINQAPNNYFSSSSEYVLAQVVEIKRPDLASADAKESLSKYSEQADAQSREELFESIVAMLKSQAQIDIDPVLLAN
jgi:peptidyl-prolyl cis-trans isomerase D